MEGVESQVETNQIQFINLSISLPIAEKTIMQNIYHENYMKFQGKLDENPLDQALKPTLGLLWSFACEITKGRKVTSMAWNPMNKVRKYFKLKSSWNPSWKSSWKSSRKSSWNQIEIFFEFRL